VRVIYPYVKIFPEALAALAGWPVEMADTSADDEAYWRLLKDLWTAGRDFVLVEQDMVVPEDALDRLLGCTEEWCGVPYRLYGNYGVWHGVTRYRGSLTRRLPGLPDAIRDRRWESLDSAWINHLRAAGYPEAHWHWPAAKHLRETPDLSGEGVKFFNCVKCGTGMSAKSIGFCPTCGWMAAPDMPKTPTASVY
jgi:hypothetical protein